MYIMVFILPNVIDAMHNLPDNNRYVTLKNLWLIPDTLLTSYPLSSICEYLSNILPTGIRTFLNTIAELSTPFNPIFSPRSFTCTPFVNLPYLSLIIIKNAWIPYSLDFRYVWANTTAMFACRPFPIQYFWDRTVGLLIMNYLVDY